LIFGTRFHLIRRHSGNAAHLRQTFEHVLLVQRPVAVEILDPVHLILEQEINERKILIPRQTPRHRGSHAGGPVQRIFAEDDLHLAGIDVILIQLRDDFLLERRAVRAGHGGIFHHGDLGVLGTMDHVGGLDLDARASRGGARKRTAGLIASR